MIKLVECTIPASFELQVKIVLYIILGGLIGLVYGLRRALMLERRIVQMDKRITKAIERRR